MAIITLISLRVFSDRPKPCIQTLFSRLKEIPLTVVIKRLRFVDICRLFPLAVFAAGIRRRMFAKFSNAVQQTYTV